MVSLIQTTIGTVLGPLVGQLDAQRQTIERQAGELGEVKRENGMLAERVAGLMVERDDLKASQAPQDANPGPVVPGSRTDGPATVTARLRALAPWLLLVAILLLAFMVGWWPGR